MNKRELYIVNAVLIILLALFSFKTFNIYSNQPLKEVAGETITSLVVEKEMPEVILERCSGKDPIKIRDTDDANLLKLQKYQKLCNSYVTDQLMIFTDFPDSEQDAVIKAINLSAKLSEFHKNSIEPLVIVEPYISTGLMNYMKYINGDYDTALEIFFMTLKSEGLSEEMMGTWVPFPESNTPNWDNKDTEPADFAIAVNKYLRAMKKYFPEAKGSILLNSTTYDPNDLLWDDGNYINLNQYLQYIDRSLVDSIGIQGFPWISRNKTNPVKIFLASEFLQPDIAIAAAQELQTRDIWFNTGSFYQKYTNDTEDLVTLSANDRKAILSGIIDTAKYVSNFQLNEYRVTINLFAEDKSKAEEATDWSYDQNAVSEDLFIDFATELDAADIELVLFDR